MKPPSQEDRLARYRLMFEKGSRLALLDALALCAQASVPMPEWVAVEILRVHRDVLIGRAVDLDEELGLAKISDPRGRRRQYVMTMNTFDVWNAIDKARGAGASINDELFEQIGERLGLGLRQVRHGWKACRALAEESGVSVFGDAFAFVLMSRGFAPSAK